MKIDDSFKKPGSVPFKWEIRPGVPKTQNPQTPSGDPRKQHQRKHLKPPPAGSYLFRPHFETRPDSFRSPPQHTCSRRFRLSGLAQPDIVSSAGCFPSPLVKTKNASKRSGGPRSRPEYGYYSDRDIPSPWSVCSRKSNASPSSSFASYQSSPRPVSDAVWASFVLF
ncbi:hypothetical protein CASFOL_016756 [Castilleja foliolosa]|uniref:Uncharacterized protein n=1 Tax=Castilleja foliolosa TaxID=1961234 RepID=A0ABD3DAE8_9LAMI